MFLAFVCGHFLTNIEFIHGFFKANSSISISLYLLMSCVVIPRSCLFFFSLFFSFKCCFSFPCHICIDLFFSIILIKFTSAVLFLFVFGLLAHSDAILRYGKITDNLGNALDFTRNHRPIK